MLYLLKQGGLSSQMEICIILSMVLAYQQYLVNWCFFNLFLLSFWGLIIWILCNACFIYVDRMKPEDLNLSPNMPMFRRRSTAQEASHHQITYIELLECDQFSVYFYMPILSFFLSITKHTYRGKKNHAYWNLEVLQSTKIVISFVYCKFCLDSCKVVHKCFRHNRPKASSQERTVQCSSLHLSATAADWDLLLATICSHSPS